MQRGLLPPQIKLLHCLPPTLTTLTGMRGLLLYQQALGHQESLLDHDEDYIVDTLGDPDADQLLLFRMMVLFFWSFKVSHHKMHQVQHTPQSADVDDDALSPPRKKPRKVRKGR